MPESPPPGSPQLDALAERLAAIEQRSDAMAKSQEATALEMREIRKLYHTEFAGRLQSMQAELDRYHEAERGHLFDDILGGLAKLYNSHEPIMGDIADPKDAKRVAFVFLELVELLQAYGVGTQKSQPGDKRNPRYCQIVERVPTPDPELHDTVVQSRCTGFYIENRPLVKELVDVYIFAQPTAGTSADNQPIN